MGPLSIRCGLSAPLAAVGMLLALAASSSSALAQSSTPPGKRLAFSQRLGVEIFAVGADWCGESIAVQVVADSKSLFERPEFGALLKSLGTRVLVNECPAAKKLSISGFEKGSAAAVWIGAAEGGEWKPAQTKAAATPTGPGPASGPGPAPGPGAPGVESVAEAPQQPALPTTDSPLGGDWVGDVKCQSYNAPKVTATLSIYEVNSSRFRAVWEKRADNGAIDRFYVEGRYDDLSRQLAFESFDGSLIRASESNSVSLTGDFAADQASITLRNICYGSGANKLSRASATPKTAHRALADQRTKDQWVAEEAARVRDWRIVGKAPEGRLRWPSCNELVDWTATFPADQRIRLFPNDNNGALRHYDDATTQRVFGSPAYYWLNDQGRNRLTKAFQEACGNNVYYSSDPKMRQARAIVDDYASLRQMSERRRYDLALNMIGPHLATRGDLPADAISNLNRFSTVEQLERHVSEFRIHADALSAAEKNGVAADVARYKQKVVEKAGADMKAEIAALPATVDSLDKLAATGSEAVKLFGAQAAADVLKAAAAKRLEIARSLVAAAVKELATAPRDFDGMTDVDLKLSALRAKLAPADPKTETDLVATLAGLDKAETRYREEARDEVIKTAQQDLAKLPATLDGARSLSAQRQMLEKALGKDAGPNFPAYQKAAAARLDEIGAAALSAVKEELAELPTAWESVDKARKLVAERAAAFVGGSVEQAYRKAGDERAAAVMSALADQAALDLREAGDISLEGVDQVLREADAAAQIFASAQGGQPFADHVLEAGRKRADDIAETYAVEFRAEIKQAAPSRRSAVTLAALSIAMDARAKRAPALAKLRDMAREAATTMYAGLCDKALAAADISASDGRTPVLVGSDISTLRQFACDLNDGEIRPSKYETPGLMASLGGGEKLYVLRVYGSEERIQAAMARRTLTSLFGKRDAQTLEDAFNQLRGKSASQGEEEAAFETPAKIVFKEIEVRPEQKALVGVQFGDDGKTESLSIRQWRELSQLLASLGKDGVNPTALCASWNKDGPKNLSAYDAGLALLTCEAKKK